MIASVVRERITVSYVLSDFHKNVKVRITDERQTTSDYKTKINTQNYSLCKILMELANLLFLDEIGKIHVN